MARKSTARQCLLCVVSLLFCVVLTGCPGGTDYPDLGTVSGTVTIDGKPTENIVVQFVPVAGGRTSVGVTDSRGYYELEYAADAKGAAVGKHQVALAAQSASSSDDQVDLSGSDSPIPEQYRDKIFEFEVKPGTNTFDIKLE